VPALGDFAAQKTLDASLYLETAKLYRWVGTTLTLIDQSFRPKTSDTRDDAWTGKGAGQPVPSVYPSAASAPTYTSLPGDLYAAAAQLAINAAPGLGCTAVWMPASMLPYNASLVTFNTAVMMLREGGLAANDAIDVMAYGASANNVADDTAAIQAAINRASVIATGQSPGQGVEVFFGPGTYLVRSALSITAYLTLRGYAYEGSVINFNLTAPGVCVAWDNHLAPRVRFGFGARDLSFAGQSATDGQTLFTLNACQGIVFSRCMFGGVGAGGGVQTAIGSLTNTSFGEFEHCFFSNCATCYNDSAATGSTENTVFNHCSFSQNISLAVGAFGVQPSQASADYHFTSCSFDSVRLVIQNGTVTTTGCHFEDPNNKLATTSLVISQNPGGNWTSIGDFFLSQSTTNGVIAWSQGNATICGRWSAASVNAASLPFVTISGSASVYIEPTVLPTPLGTNVTAYFSGTSTGICGLLPLPETLSADRGDAAVTLAPVTDFQTQLFNTPLTAARAVTLNTALNAWGAKFRIVRGAGATGAFNLNVGAGPLKALTVAGQWVDVVLQQTGSWIETASGSL